MRLRILHETIYRYASPASRAIQILRLTPRGHDGQFVINWRIDIDRDCRLQAATDPFGNRVHSFTVEGPLDGLVITAEGEVETMDMNGIVRDQVERLPVGVFLRETPLTAADESIRAFAEDVAKGAGSNPLDVFHALMLAIHRHMRFDVNATDTGTSAAEAFAHGHGVCQDFAHVFVAAARHLGHPARYVGGYLYQPALSRLQSQAGRVQIQTADAQGAGHAWAEARVENLGWIGFDPANGVSPTDAYVRVAVGLDYLGAAPVRGTRYGGSGETLAVRVIVHDSSRGGR
ncbi:MAG TPA: transglutaminase family protein [Bauldia sp.]|nr:transglutaminase family protein [Bauldia sp.]